MQKRSILFAMAVSALICFCRPVAAEDPVETVGVVDAVTVYREQALVTRVVDVRVPVGLHEVVVTALPERIVPDSIFAEADPGVEVRGVRYRTRPVPQDVRDDVRKLDDQLRDLADKTAANVRYQQLSTERRSFLDHLEQFTASTANAELSKGVLNADTLKQLTTFIFDQRSLVATEDLKLAKENRDLKDTTDLLTRQRAALTAGAQREVREAVVFADFKNAAGRLRIRYLVDSASWSPSYVVRADAAPVAQAAKPRPVRLQYNASIQQMSGEDWNNVTMTLSTAIPSMVASAPALDPLEIVLGNAGEQQGQQGGQQSYAVQKSALSSQRRQLEAQRNANSGQQQNLFQNNANGPADNGKNQQDADLNSLAGKLQVLELIAKDAGGHTAPNGGGGDLEAEQQGISVTYQVQARTSLPSRNDQQSIQIAALDLQGDFYKLAMPVLTNYVYDQATVGNQSKIVLLAGPVASYLDDQYVGAGTLPTVAIGEKFTIGFGIDSSLRATRELIDKTETTQGGNRLLTFNYRLSVENFGSAAASVRLSDRLPTSKNQDVRVTLVSSSKEPGAAVVDAGASLAGVRRPGILNWSLDVAPQAMGEKAATVDYQYKLEFDKQLGIAGLAGDQ